MAPAPGSPPTAYERVAAALAERDTPLSGAGKAHCPAHDDRVESLSVNRGDDRAVVLHCHAGCESAAVLKALRLPADLLSEPAAEHARKKVPRRERYIYRDPATGKRVFTMVRIPKPGGGKEYICDPAGSHKVIVAETGTLPLYREERLADAREHSWPVYLVEGEGNADRLQAWADEEIAAPDLVAVSHCNGAKAWRPTYAIPLKDLNVTVVVDRDGSGSKWAEAVRRDLEPVARSLRFVQSATTGKGHDIVDHLDAGHGLDDLVAWRDASSGRALFSVLDWADLSEPVPPMRWLVKGVWPERSFGPVAGEKKTLKTYTLMHMALAVASGQAMFGTFPVPEAVPVLYVLGEGGSIPSVRRLQRMAHAMGIADMEGVPARFLFGTAAADDPTFMDLIAEHLDQLQPGLVILDPLYAFHPSDIDSQDLYKRGPMLTRLAQTLSHGGDAAVVIADHFKKTGNGALDLDSIGQAGVAAWADSWMLQRHRSNADVANGAFWLEAEFGSRQWGGRRWQINWDLGAFDDDTGEHVGEIRWDVYPIRGSESATTAEDRIRSRIKTEVLQALRDTPEGMTKTGLRETVTGNKAKVSEVVDELHALGQVTAHEQETADRRGAKRPRTVFMFASEKIHLRTARDGGDGA